MRRTAFTLVELLVVIAVLALLAGILAPSVSAAREVGRRARCLANLHHIHMGLLSYGNANSQCLPPFAGAGYGLSMAVSGHWGGTGADDIPAANAAVARYANLYSLLQAELISPDSLICPSSQLKFGGPTSLFAFSPRFSSYCMRMPYSSALFDQSPNLANYCGKLLGIYERRGGGFLEQINDVKSRVPLVRMDRQYASDISPNRTFDPAADVILSDAFWYQDYSPPPPTKTYGCKVYSVKWSWAHGRRFNTLRGGGAAATVEDDDAKTVANNTVAPGAALPDDGKMWASYAEAVWLFFDSRK